MAPEVLAPAGSLESLIAAINCGADAVYVGGKHFSARQNASNFDEDELKQAIDLCHLHGIKIYLTVNTIMFDCQVQQFSEFVKNAALQGVDAFIVQDLGAAEIIRKIIPDANIHGSTQMTVHSVSGAEFLKELGFKRVVLSRELSENQIRKISNLDIETEVFVHGALCMSVSGQCYLSSLIGQRSANRGLCAQPCRLPYSTMRKPEDNGLSLKDLSLINHLDRLSNAGVASFKIEGRMKRPEYVASAVLACRQSLSGQKPDMSLLRSVFSRNGFTDGYFTEKRTDMFGKREKEDVISAKDILPEIKRQYSIERKSAEIKFKAVIKKEQPVKISGKYNEYSSEAIGEMPETAIKKAADSEFIEKQLSKLGGTVFTFGGVECDIDDGLSISAKSLNALRREIADDLNFKIIKGHTPNYSICKNDIILTDKREDLSEMRVRIFRENQFEAAKSADKIIMPYELFLKIRPEDTKKIIIEPPRFISDEEHIIEGLHLCCNAGVDAIMCNNPAYIKIGKDLGFKLHGDFGLNCSNSYSLKFLKDHGFEDVILSFEMKLSQINNLKKNIKTGIIAYGYLPAMLTVNCPVKNLTGCEKCSKTLYDRTNRSNKIICHGNYTEILNSQLLYMADRIEDIKNVSFITLYFNDESPEIIKKTIGEYKTYGEKKDNITRGLYYRGVL